MMLSDDRSGPKALLNTLESLSSEARQNMANYG